MNTDERGSRQRRLPFAEAEASYADRRNMLAGALARVECDLAVARFCLWVFDVTKGGVDGELAKSYEELAARPFGLCCSPTTAKQAVRKAKHLGLVSVCERRYVSFGQRSNGYTIDWDGVRRLLDYSIPIGGIGYRLADSAPRSDSASPQADSASPQADSASPIRNIYLFESSTKTSIDRSGERKDLGTATDPKTLARSGSLASSTPGPIDWQLVKAEANELCRKIDLHPREIRDRRLLLGAIACVVGQALPRSWLDEALAGWRDNRHNHHRPWGYLHVCLVNGAADRGVDFRSTMARIEVPETLLRRAESGSRNDER